MAGPNLEIFKFGLYLFFPLAMMVHYGNPVWYQRHVIPYREKLFPRAEETNKVPTTREDIRVELEKTRAARIARRLERQDGQGNSH